MADLKHKINFDFLFDVQQDEVKRVRSDLEKMLSNIKIGIDTDKTSAEKYVAEFNKVFAKAKMPTIDTDKLINDFNEISEAMTKAVGLINNIDTSVLKGIEITADRIADTVDKIATKVGAIKVDDKAAKGLENGFKRAGKAADDLTSKVAGIGDNITITPEVDTSNIPKQIENATNNIKPIEVKVDLITDKTKIKERLDKMAIDLDWSASAATASKQKNEVVEKYTKQILDEFNFDISEDEVKQKVKGFVKTAGDPSNFANKLLKNATAIKIPVDVKENATPPVDDSKPIEVTVTPIMEEGAVAKAIKDNATATPPTVEITPTLADNAIADVIQKSLNDAGVEVEVKAKLSDDDNDNDKPNVTFTPTFEPGSIAQAAIDNVTETPATVTITPKFEDGAIAKAVAESVGQNPDIVNNVVKDVVERAVAEGLAKKDNTIPTGAQSPQSASVSMSREDAVGYIASNYDYNTWEQWFTTANDTARTKIADMIEKDEKLRNATLNQMWDEYKKLYDSSISFEEFLQTEIPLYRGEDKNSKSKSEKATSFTLNKKILEGYDSIFETKIKPIDTLGMPRPLMAGGESEVFVPNDYLKNQAGYNEWVKSIRTEVVAHQENTTAIKEETQAQKELNTEKKKESLTLLAMYAKKPDIWKDKLQNILHENPGIIDEYTAKRDNLQSQMQSVQDTTNRISKNASVAKIPYNQLNDEIVKTGKALSTMYDAGITDTEEYITLQYKLLNLLEKARKQYGTVKSSGAKNKTELQHWVRDGLQRETGYDVYTAFDALREGKNSVLDSNSGKQRTMRDVASQLVGYKGFADFDAQDLDEYKTIVSGLTQIRDEIQASKVESDALNESLEKQASFHDTKSGQMSMFPETEQEKIAKTKSVVAAVTEENTAKVEQISIDDVLEQSSQEVAQAEQTETALIKANTEAVKENVEAKRELANVNNQQSTDGYEEFYQSGGYGDDASNNGFKVTKHKTRKKDGVTIAESETAEGKTDNAIKTVEATKVFTELGEITLVTITEDFKKFNKESEKTKNNLEKAKKKLGEFLDKFNSKTGGKAEFVKGFNKLNSFYNSDSLNADNIEETYNKMIELQKEYAKLELSFRKGQSSLNPFVNSINKAENIDNIFGNVQNKFDGLIVRSDELTDNFEKLRVLAEKIKAFSGRMAAGDDIGTAEFAEFAQDMGNFNLLRTQVEGQIKSEGRNTPNRNKYLKDLGKMYTRKGELGAIVQAGGTEEEKVELMLLRAKIKAKEQYLSLSKEESAVLQQNARDAFSQQQIIESAKQKDMDSTARAKEVSELILKQEKLGKLEAQYEKTNKQEKKNVVDILQKEISAKEKSLNLTAEEVALMQQKKKTAYDLELGKQTGKLADKDKDKELKELMRESRAKYRVNKANSVYNSGLNLQDELGMLPTSINQKEVDIINKFNAAMKELKDTKSQIKPGEIIDDTVGKKLEQQRLEVQKTSIAVKELLANYEMLSNENSTYSGKVFAGGDMQTALIDAAQGMHKSKIQVKEFDETTRMLTYTVKTGAREFTTYKMGIRDTDNQMRRLTGTTKKTEGFFESTKRKMGEITSYFTGMAMISRVTGELRKGIQYIRDIDLALTELKKVTDETEETYDKFLDTASKTAAKVGSTIKEVVSSTADFARLGYTLKEAAVFAESAQILMNVSEFTDVSRATDTLISAVQAFGYTAETSMEVVDLLNMIGNNYAISTADLAQSLTKSSASLVAAGGNLAEAAALTATANKIVQDADSVGTALKTTSLRLRGTSVDILNEEGLDSEGAVTSKSKLQSKVKALSGVDILTETGEYKSTYQILSQIADVWADINDMDQAALLELISGKRNSSVIAAILQNPKELKEAFEDANNAEGSALRENEKYLDSIQGKIDQFNNAVQTMWSNTLDSGVVKLIVDLGTGLVKIVDKLGLINTLVFGVITYLSVIKKDKLDFASILGIHDIDNGWFNKKKNNTNTLVKDTLIPDKQAEIKALEKDIDDVTKAGVAKIEQGKINLVESVGGQLAFDFGDTKNSSQTSKFLNIFENGLGKDTEKLTYDTHQLGVELDKLNNMDNAGIINYMNSLDDLGDVGDDTKHVIAGYASTVKDGNDTVQGATEYVNQYNQQLQQTSVAAARARLAQAGLNIAISLVTAALTALITKLIELATNAQKKFDKLSTQLSQTESELKNINSQLDETKGRIQELQEQGVLTITDREELDRLRALNDELERQQQLTEQIKAQQQQGVNEAAIDAANQYKKVGRNSGKTTGEKIGSGALTGTAIGGAVAGTALAAAGGAAGLATALGVTGATQAWNPVGWGLLIAAGIVAIGTAIGAGVGAASGAIETKVGESMENMREEHEKLQKKYEKKRQKFAEKGGDGRRKRMEKASEELAEYESIMAEHFAEMEQYYSSIDLSIYDEVKDADTIDRLRTEMNEFYDTRDKWLIQSGGANAKSNAISRIFGENASQELKDIKKNIRGALDEGEEFDYDTAFDEEFKQRLYDMGLTVADVKYYFTELKKAEDEAAEFTTEDAIKSVANLADKVDSLKGAFDEFNKTGIVTAKTLISLSETFGGLGDKWTNFVKMMTSGTASTEEAKKAINDLVETLITSALSGEQIGTDQYVALWSQLTNMGVKNASEILDGIKNYSTIGEQIASDVINNEKTIEQAIADYEKANNIVLTAEQKQVVVATHNAKTAKEKADTYQKQSNTLSTLASEYERVAAAEKEWEDEVDTAKDTKSGKFLGFLWKIQTDTDKERETNAILNEEETQKQREAIEKQISNLYSEVFGSTGTATDTNVKILELQTFFESPNNYDELSQETQDALDKLSDELGLNIDIELVDPSDLVDQIQNVFDTLQNAVNEFNENGYLSIDTAQALTDPNNIDPKYLTLLEDSNGELQLTKENLYKVAIARLTDLKIKRQDAILTDAENLAKNGSIEKLKESSEVLYSEADALQTVNKERLKTIRGILEERQAKGELVGFDIDSYMTNLEGQIDATGKIFDSAINNIENSFSTAGNTATAEAKSELQKLLDYYDNRISANAAKQEQIQNEIDLAEQMGMKADKSYYDEKLKLMAEQEALLQQKKADLLVELGKVADVGSDEWWEIANELNNIEGELDDVTSSIVDLQDAIGEIDTYQFDEFENRLDKLTSKLQTMRDLMAPNGEEDWFDDEGGFTAKGTAVLGSYLQELEFYKQGLAQVEADMVEFGNKSYNDLTQAQRDALTERGIHSEQEYYDWVTKLDDAQLDYLSNISDTQVAIGDMYEASIDAVEEYTQTLVESYNDYIDACKEALDAERDLYTFKKDIQKQNKDIAATERRIAALAGSTNASDIAERRKLEAQLAEQKESLNDTYYEHSMDSQQNALDAEAQAYEESMNRFVDNLRTSLDTALGNMDSFLAGVSASVMVNAQIVKDQYIATGVTLDDAIVTPWDNAIAAIGTYETDGLSKMNAWTTDAGFFGQFADGAKEKVTGFWGAGIKACDGFKMSIDGALKQISTNISTNVTKWREDIASVYNDVQDAAENPPKLKGQGDVPTDDTHKTYHVTGSLDYFGLNVMGTGATEKEANDNAKINLINEFLAYQMKQGTSEEAARQLWSSVYKNKAKYTKPSYYAKGTLGTSKNEWMMTDEIGDELVMYATPEGTLSYARVGTTVVPADITANLVEWGKLNPDMMKIGGGANINAISNIINKPEFNLSFDALVKAERIDENTLPEVKKFVQQEINNLVKQMNYALRGKGAR